MIYYHQLQRLDYDQEGRKPEEIRRSFDREAGVAQWATPLTPREGEKAEPRVTEDGLSVPDWWTDEETESQTWLASQGVML